MQWLVEQMGIRSMPGLPEENDVKLLSFFEKSNRPFIEIKQIPFTQELLIDRTFDFTKPSLIYGSCQIVEKVTNQHGNYVQTFNNSEWWDPASWIGKRLDLLNDKVTPIRTRELRDKWVKGPVFVKSVEVKKLTGMVIEPDKEDWDNWLIEQSQLDGDDMLLISPIHKIEREWRFFVVDSKLITGSTYRKDGYRAQRWPVSPEAWNAANKAIQEWMPSQNIVIDIARTWAGEYKVIEFNCLSSSGFYNCDVGKIVEAMEEYNGRETV